MRNVALHRLLGLALLTLVPVSAHAQQAAQAAPLRGDVNGDGRVTAADAQAVRDHVAGRPAAPGIQLLPNGDANGDGRITGVDAAMIQAFAAGRDVSRFGVGQPIAGGAGGGEQKKNDNLMGLYVCTVDVETNTHSCETPRPQMGASADYLLGKPNVTYVTTGAASSRGNPADEDTTSMNVAVTNHIGQPIGTVDGTTAAASGVRVFFHDGPRVTSVKSGTLASAAIRLEGTDGTADFAGPEGEFPNTGKPFYRYNGVLATGATSAARAWTFVYSANTKTYTYAVQVSAPLQYEFGKVNIAPTSLVLGEGETSAALTATVVNALFATVSDGVTWSSSNTAVATVDASGVVTAVAQGTATITATSQVKAQRTGSIPVTVDRAPTIVSTNPADNATQVAGSGNIEITFSEAVDVTTSSFTLECPASTAKTFTVSGSGTAVITLNPDADLPAGTRCTVKVIGAQVSDSDTNDGPNFLAADRTFSFDVNIQAVADVFGTTTTGNVRINSASTSPAFSVTANDQFDAANTTITFAGWNGVAGKTQQGGDVAITASGAGMGQFTYNPAAGFEGTDSLEYTIASGTGSASAKVALPVSGMIWFVNNNGAACTSRANGCGRLTSPYSTLAAFHAENNGTGNNPAANEAIFVYQSATAYAGPVTLLNGQKLIGQDATATLQALSGITPAAGSDALPAVDAAGDAVTIAGTDGVNLGAGNLLRGLTLAPTAGEAIGGTSFGTLTLSTGTPDLAINAGGQALSLTTGSIAGTFTSVASAGGTNNVLLSGVTGDIDFGAGALSGSTGGAIKIVGGPLTLDASGSITQATAAPLLDVSGAHTGTLTFTGTLSATAGTGLQFSDADGTYSFAGTTTLNGGDAAIDIVGGSGGAFTFASGTAVTNPTGAAFRVAGSAPTVTYDGNLTKSGTSAGLLVDISDQASGTITFANGTLLGTSTNAASTGIQLSNADGTVSFNGTTTLSGGDNGVDVIGGSTGAISFATGSTITNPSGIALRVFNAGVNTNVAFAGNISTNTGRPVHIEGVSGGTVSVTGTIAATGQGLLAQNNSGGTFSFTNASKTFNTTTNAAVTLSSNTGATISFTNGLAITTTTGAGINATGGGNLTVQGTLNTISTGTGTALTVSNTTIAAGGVTFRSISSSGAVSGIVLNNTGTTAGLTVTGNGGTCNAAGATCTGGAIQNSTGVGISLAGTRSPSFNRIKIVNSVGSGIAGTGVTNFSFTNGTIDNSGTGSGADAANIDFFANTAPGTENNLAGTVTIQGNTLSNAYYHGIDIFNYAGTIDTLGISDNVITTPTSSASSLGHGIRVVAFGSTGNVATITRATINNNQIYNVPSGVGLQVQCANASMTGPATSCGQQGSGTNVIRITNNRIQGQSAASPINAEGMIALVNGVGQGNFLINGNTVRYVRGTAISHSAFGNAQVTSTIAGNTIEAHNINLAQGIGIGTSYTTASGAAETPMLTSTISNNTISETNGSGILSVANDVNGTVRVKVLNNNVAAPLGGTYGIQIRSGSAAGNNTVCARVENNITAGGTTAGGTLLSGIGIRKQGTTAGVNTFGIHGLSPSPATSVQAESHVASFNPNSAVGANGRAVSSISGSNYESCNLP